MPVRELMKRFADDTYGSTLDKVNAALDSVEKAFAVKSGFFNGNAVAESRFNQIKTADKHYLAHEYFNRDWQPFYFSDIMGEFSNAKVSFIGSAELYDPYLALYTNESGRQTITMLTASGQAGPFLDKGTHRKSTARMNQAILQTLGQRMQKEGKMIQDPEENKAEIRSKLEGFMKTDLPYLKLIEIAQS